MQSPGPHSRPLGSMAQKREVPKSSPEEEALKVVDGNVKWDSLFRKQFGSFLKKLNTELPYDLAIQLLGI